MSYTDSDGFDVWYEVQGEGEPLVLSGGFGLLNRYEVALWRQTVQTIVALRAVRRQW